MTRAGVTGPRGTEARRVLIVHAIGSAAFTTAPTPHSDQPLSAAEARRSYVQGLRWLINGITNAQNSTQPIPPASH